MRVDQPWAGVHWSRVPGMEMDDDTARTLGARLDARQPFEDLPVRLLRDDGGVREITLSGEPRYDAWGRFQGFWGVARDMTPQMAAQREVAASEVRYRELFTHCPLPLVLHRSGIVLDANPLEDVRNTRRIASIYLRGAAVDRSGIGGRLRAQ